MPFLKCRENTLPYVRGFTKTAGGYDRCFRKWASTLLGHPIVVGMQLVQRREVGLGGGDNDIRIGSPPR